jgi:hypothetical protein
MRRPDRPFVVVATLILSCTSCATVWSQAAEEPLLQMQREKIERREERAKGIEVSAPKVYDDSLLQEMLRSAEARLASLQMIDQAGIAGHLGSLSGARQSISSFGLSVMGSPTPQVATTNNGATNSVVTTDSGDPTKNGTVTTAGAPVQNQTTTASAVSPPAVTAPASSTTLPSAFGVSASDLLNEQMQLTYEIANLRLLLEGALSDRVLGPGGRLRPRVTLGFPISIVPSKEFKNAAAVIEIQVDADSTDLLKGGEDQPPIVLALLPREKTYNVAAITDHMSSLGAGVVTQIASVSASWLFGTKTYYMAQDQDTVARTFEPDENHPTSASASDHRVGFLWQFRPVLGAKYIREGLKQTFVQLAFPSALTADRFGYAHIITYWREYDRKRNLVKRVIPNSLRRYEQPFVINRYPLKQEPLQFDWRNLEDLGNGQMLVTVKGLFLPGTYVRVGGNYLRDGNPSFSMQYQQIQFTAPIADLATKGAYLVARDGDEKRLEFPVSDWEQAHPLRIETLNITTMDDSNSRVVVQLEEAPDKTAPTLLLIGSKVFGYSDSPLLRNDDPRIIAAVVPTSYLQANPMISLKSLFTNKQYWREAARPFRIFPLIPNAPKAVLLEQTKDKSSFLIYGDDIRHANILSPKVTWHSYGMPEYDNVARIDIDKEALKSAKLITLQTDRGVMFQVPIPKLDKDDDNAATIVPPAPIALNTDEIVLTGTGLGDLQQVESAGINLKLTTQADGKAVWISGLKAAGVTTTAGTHPLQLHYKAKQEVLSLTVVAIP